MFHDDRGDRGAGEDRRSKVQRGAIGKGENLVERYGGPRFPFEFFHADDFVVMDQVLLSSGLNHGVGFHVVPSVSGIYRPGTAAPTYRRSRANYRIVRWKSMASSEMVHLGGTWAFLSPHVVVGALQGIAGVNLLDFSAFFANGLPSKKNLAIKLSLSSSG